MLSRNIRFAVVGTGAMAATMMSTLAKAGVRVTAVASRDPDRARRFARAFTLPAGESDLESVLARGDVDAIYVANAPQYHAATCIAALEAGKAVLCEKPMALSEAEAHQVAHAAQKAQTLCMEGLWTLLLPAYRRFFDFARSGGLGRTKNLTADFGYPADAETERRWSAEARGGVLLDRAIYLIALALSVLGPVEQIDAQLDFTDLGVDKDAFLQLRHESGGRSQLAASFNCLMANTATLACSGGLIRLEAPLIGSETVSVIRHAPRAISAGDVVMQAPSFSRKMIARLRESPRLRRVNRAIRKPATRHVPFGPDQYLPQLNHFISLLRAGARESDIVPLKHSLEIQRIIGRARADCARRASC